MTPPLLTYACTTNPFPLQASPAQGGSAVATVQVVATNATGAAVTLGGMSIQLPVGPGADALTLDPASIAVVPPPGWTQGAAQSPPGAVVYTFLPGTGAGTVPAGGSLTFMLNAMRVNQQAGTATVTVAEGSGGCSPPACPTASLPVTKFPAGWGNVEFRAVKPDVSPGDDASVQWSGPAGATYMLRYYTPATGPVTVPTQGAPPLGSSGVYPGAAGPALPLQLTTVFTLDVAYTAGGATYLAQRQVTVEVMDPAPTITRFDGQVSGPPGPPVLTLTWEASEDALRYQISGVAQTLNPQGTLTLPNPLDPAPVLPEYTFTVYGRQKLTARRVFQVPPRITRFTGTAVASGAGMRLQLTWETWLGDRCAITGVPGDLPTSGTVTLTPTAQQPLANEYTLTVTARGKTDTSTLWPRWGGDPVARQGFSGGYFQPTPQGALALTPDGRVLVPLAQAVSLLSAATLQPLTPASMPVGSDVGPIALNPAGTRVFIAGGTTLAAYDAQTLQPALDPVPIPVAVPSRQELQLSAPGAGLAVSADGGRVFVSSPLTPSVPVLDAQTLELIGMLPLPGPATAMAASPDGRTLVFAGADAVYQVDAQTYAPSASPIPLSVGIVLSVAVTADSALALVAAQPDPLGTSFGIWSVDLRSGAVQAVPVALAEPQSALMIALGVAVSPDGANLYALVVRFGGNWTAEMVPLRFLRTVIAGGVGG